MMNHEDSPTPVATNNVVNPLDEVSRFSPTIDQWAPNDFSIGEAGQPSVEVGLGDLLPPLDSQNKESEDGFEDGLDIMFSLSCGVAVVVGTACIFLAFSGHTKSYNQSPNNSTTVTQFEDQINHNTYRLHYGLMLVGFLSVVQGAAAFVGWFISSEQLLFRCQHLYTAVIVVASFLLFLSWLQNTSMSTSAEERLSKLWEISLQQDPTGLCQVQKYFSCSGFRQPCVTSPQPFSALRSPTAHLKRAPLFFSRNSVSSSSFRLNASNNGGTTFSGSSFLGGDATTLSCPTDCLLPENRKGVATHVLGYSLTPQDYLEKNPFETSCFERFDSFCGVTRTITMIACLTIIIHALYARFLYPKILLRNPSQLMSTIH